MTKGSGSRSGAGGFGRGALMALVAAVVVAADQVTKTWALHHARSARHLFGPVYLVLTFNKGAAFSLGAGVAPVVEAVVFVLVAILILVSGKARRHVSVPVAVALGLLVGGAMGNLIDRLLRHHGGGVIDFIQLVSWWPVFNVADAAITIGAVMIVLTWSGSRAPRKSPHSPAPERGREVLR